MTSHLGLLNVMSSLHKYSDHTCFFIHERCQIPRKLFEHDVIRQSVQHLPRDPASANVLKKTCVIIIMASFTWFQTKANRKHSLKLKMPLFSYTGFLQTNGVSVKLSIVITSPVQRCLEQKRRLNAQFGQQHFPCNARQTNRAHFSYVKLKPMFKQHVNLMI